MSPVVFIIRKHVKKHKEKSFIRWMKNEKRKNSDHIEKETKIKTDIKLKLMANLFTKVSLYAIFKFDAGSGSSYNGARKEKK